MLWKHSPVLHRENITFLSQNSQVSNNKNHHKFEWLLTENILLGNMGCGLAGQACHSVSWVAATLMAHLIVTVL